MRRPLLCSFVPLLAAAAAAQRPTFSLDEVLERPEMLTPQLPAVQWIEGESALCIVESGADGVDVAARQQPGRIERTRLFSAADLVDALVTAGVRRPPAPPRKLPPFSFVDPETVRFEVLGAVWHWRFADENLAPERRLAIPEGATARAIAPGDARGAFVVRHDIVVVDRAGTKRITEDGAEGDVVYGEPAHRAEFGIHDALWWDAAGRRLAFSREDMRGIAPYPYADYDELPARPEHGRYPMAGRVHSSVTIGVHDTETGATVWLENDPDADVYWTNVTFSPGGERIYVALVARAQDRMELVEFDAATGERLRTLLEESDAEWVEPEQGPIFLPDGSGFLWFSSRDGFRHLWRHSLDGELLWRETEGDFDVRAFVGFAPSGETAYVMASTAEDPLSMHCWRVRLGRPQPVMAIDEAGPEMERVTVEPGWHECTLSSEGAILDHWSSLTVGGVLEVWLPEGRRVRLHYTDLPIARDAAGDHELFELTADDGRTLHGDVILPPDPDPLRRYPVLLYVYGGPKSQLVRNRWDGGAGLWLHYMAQQGYVVVRLDNRGTDNRGIEFSQVVHRHLGELEVVDQLAAVHHVLEKYPFADRENVAVHGWSYGGYLTLRLMLLAPDTFACGVAGAPVTDWLRYETGYTERYMDLPRENPEGYAQASILPLVDRLRGDLLLVHGTDDKTVMWSHSMAFLDRCIDEGILVDFMAYPMQQHGLKGKDRAHFYRHMTAWLLEHAPPPARD